MIHTTYNMKTNLKSNECQTDIFELQTLAQRDQLLLVALHRQNKSHLVAH